jgi:CBS domain-containing protein
MLAVSSRRVSDLLAGKGASVVTIGQQATVLDALSLMAREDIGALVVVDGDIVCGVLSERDYARKVVLLGRRSFDTQVRDIMSSRIVSVTPDTDVDGCMALMTRERVRHLPVLDAGRLAGIVSIGDVVKAIIDAQQEAIGQLEQYISGRA